MKFLLSWFYRVLALVFAFSSFSSCYGESSEDADVESHNDLWPDIFDATEQGEDSPTADTYDSSFDTVLDESLDVSAGCGQVIPSITSAAPEWCADRFPGSCLDHVCGPCQVCYVDITAPPLDNADAPIFGCEGDGQCHDLCATDSDCAENEECLNIGWWNGHDVPSACLMMCWSRAYPPDLSCP